MGKKHEFEYIRKYFEVHRCELLEKEYKNNSTLMRYKCDCENTSKISFHHFKNGHRCRKCAGTEKYSFKYVQQYFKDQGCELLDKEYINNKTIMKYKCSCENIDDVVFLAFKKGQKCNKCSKKEKHTFSSIKKYFLDNGCNLLEETYVNCSTKMKYRCSCRKISKITFANFKKGKRCKKCGIEKKTGKNNHNWIANRQVVKENKQIRNKCYTMLRNFYKHTNLTKTNKTANLLGYTVEELKNHIHNHPNWTNIDKNNWHLDHIFPIKAFLDYNIQDLELINCLDNLRPLSEQKNLAKHCKYNKNKFENWLTSKGTK